MKFGKTSSQDRAGIMSNIYALYHGMSDHRVQWYIKLLSILIIAYVVSPVDLIPDFIPVIGLLDEVVLVPIAIACIVRLIPDDVYSELAMIKQDNAIDKKFIYFGCMLVVSIWILFTAIVYILLN